MPVTSSYAPPRAASSPRLALILVVALLASVFTTVPAAEATSSAVGGPMVLDGNDPGDHDLNTYINDVYARLDANIAGYTHNDTTAVIGTCADSTDVSAGAGYLRLWMTDRKFAEIDTPAKVADLFSDIGANNYQHIHICSSGDSPSTLLSDVEAELNKWGAAIAAHVNRGGGLFATHHGYGWLSDLFPSLTVEYGGSSQSYVTADGANFFTNLQENDVLSAVNHNTFADIGTTTLLTLLTTQSGGAGNAVAIGGTSVTFPQITIEATTGGAVGDAASYTLKAADGDGTPLAGVAFDWEIASTDPDGNPDAEGSSTGSAVADENGEYILEFDGYGRPGETRVSVELTYGEEGSETTAGTATTTSWTATTPIIFEAVDQTGADGSVRVRWDAPTETNGTVSSYTLEHSQDGTTWTEVDGDTTGRDVTVTGLDNGTEYTFRVAASDDGGLGEWSELVTVTPVGSPAAPTLQSAIGVDGTVTVSWATPAETNGEDPTHYVLEHSPTGEDDWTTVDPGPTQSPVTIEGLTADTTYDFRLAAVNSDGQGPWSDSIINREPSRPAPTPEPDPEPLPGDDGELQRPVAGSGQVTFGDGADGDGSIPTVTSTGSRASVIGDGFQIDVWAADGDGAATDTGVGDVLRVPQGGNAGVSVDGFSPNSKVRVWLFSEPTLIGEFETDGDGALEVGLAEVVADLSPCAHTLQSEGKLADGRDVAAAIGVWVTANPFPFGDVDPNGYHAPGIGCLESLDIVSGYTEDVYDESDPITRAQAASIVAQALGLPEVDGTTYQDTAGSGHAGTIEALKGAGIALGVGDNRFDPLGLLDRGQAATLLARAAGLDGDTNPSYSDTSDNVHEASIGALTDAGVIDGFGDGTFRPQLQVTRGQFASLVARALPLLADRES